MSAVEAPAERLHPLALVSGLGQAARSMFGAIAAGGYFAFQGRPGLGLLMVGGIAGIALTSLLLNWLRFTYRVGSDAVQIDSGILSRNQRTIPFDRVQDVSIAQGPLQRLVGVAQVTLETGGSAAGKEDGVLGGIGLVRAEALRDHVRRRRGGVQAVAEQSGEHPAPLFFMDVPRLIVLGLFNFSLAVFAGLFGASQTFGDVFDIDPFERKFWRPLLVESGLGEWLLAHRIGLAVAGLAVLVATGVVTGMIRTFLREWGFRVDRTGSGLRRRRGLLTRTDVTLPVRRVQAGVIATGPIRQNFGWFAFKVQSLASDSGEGKGVSDHLLAPLARWDELRRIAAEFDWTLPGDGTQWRQVSKAYVWSYCLLLAPVFPLLLFFYPLRLLAWQRTAFALDGERLLIRSGWWRRRTLLIPLRNIQTAMLKKTALSRRFGAAHVVIDIAGGSAFGNVIPYLPRNEASLLRRDLLRLQP